MLTLCSQVGPSLGCPDRDCLSFYLLLAAEEVPETSNELFWAACRIAVAHTLDDFNFVIVQFEVRIMEKSLKGFFNQRSEARHGAPFFQISFFRRVSFVGYGRSLYGGVRGYGCITLGGTGVPPRSIPAVLGFFWGRFSVP